jgi:hypothetical protein
LINLGKAPKTLYIETFWRGEAGVLFFHVFSFQLVWIQQHFLLSYIFLNWFLVQIWPWRVANDTISFYFIICEFPLVKIKWFLRSGMLLLGKLSNSHLLYHSASFLPRGYFFWQIMAVYYHEKDGVFSYILFLSFVAETKHIISLRRCPSM